MAEPPARCGGRAFGLTDTATLFPAAARAAFLARYCWANGALVENPPGSVCLRKAAWETVLRFHVTMGHCGRAGLTRFVRSLGCNGFFAQMIFASPQVWTTVFLS